MILDICTYVHIYEMRTIWLTRYLIQIELCGDEYLCIKFFACNFCPIDLAKCTQLLCIPSYLALRIRHRVVSTYVVSLPPGRITSSHAAPKFTGKEKKRRKKGRKERKKL